MISRFHSCFQPEKLYKVTGRNLGPLHPSPKKRRNKLTGLNIKSNP